MRNREGIKIIKGIGYIVASCVFFCTLSPFEKGSTLKGKNLLPKIANSFLLE